MIRNSNQQLIMPSIDFSIDGIIIWRNEMELIDIEKKVKDYFWQQIQSNKLQTQISYLTDYIASQYKELEHAKESFEMLKSSGITNYNIDNQKSQTISDPTYQQFIEHEKVIKEIEKVIWDTRKELRIKKKSLTEIQIFIIEMKCALAILAPNKRYYITEYFQIEGKSIKAIAINSCCDESTIREHIKKGLIQLKEILK